MAPILELITAPHRLSSLVTWASKLITGLINPIILPNETFIIHLARPG